MLMQRQFAGRSSESKTNNSTNFSDKLYEQTLRTVSATIQQHDPKIVEAIVREVLLRLKSNVSFEKPSNSRLPHLRPEEENSDHSIRLTEKVITLESLRDKLSGTKQIQIQSSAIVTPAVKDELRQLKIDLVFDAATPNRNEVRQFYVARLTDHFVATEWLKPLGSVSICCGDDYEKVAVNLVSKLGHDQQTTAEKQENRKPEKAICIAAQPFVAVASLNREQQLRAAFARTEREVSEIKATLNANVLIVESNQSRSDQFKLIESFLK